MKLGVPMTLGAEDEDEMLLYGDTWERGHMPRHFRDPGQHTNTARLPRWAALVIAMIIATFLWIDVWGVALLVRHMVQVVWP